MNLPPRIRGKIGVIEDPPELKGKFAFEIFVADFYGRNIVSPIGPFGPFDSEKEAQRELKIKVRLAAEAYEMEETGKISGEYMDMRNEGTLRKWDEN